MGTYIIDRAANIARGLGGGVASLIACSRGENLADYENEHTAPDGTVFHFGSWFRLYSDGFVEQGIISRDYYGVRSDNDNAAFQFPIPFKDTNYTVSLACNSEDVISYHNKTKYSIIAAIGPNDLFDPNYQLCVTARGFVSQETIDSILAGKVWATGPYDGTSPFHVWIDDPYA